LNDREQLAPKSANVTTVSHRVAADERSVRNGHEGGILWFTGLSGAGKSTLAMELERALFINGYQVYVLDGDNIRQGLSADLGFSPEDRVENIRRVGEVASLFAEAGVIAITAFISPYRADREGVRAVHAQHFHEIFINAPLDVCEARDVKGLYSRARRGEIKEFTGISAPYEPPVAADLVIPTHLWPVDRCIAELMTFINQRLSRPRAPQRARLA
jgi:bifunctional enzyme CysN/CysC